MSLGGKSVSVCYSKKINKRIRLVAVENQCGGFLRKTLLKNVSNDSIIYSVR